MSADARERILDACERTIAEAGLRGFRMTAVAREAGVSIGLLSYHFGDRDGLLQAALDRVNEGTALRAAHDPHAVTPLAELETLLCSEFGDEPHVRAGSIVWNELRAAAVFAPAQAAALRSSTASWQDTVRTLSARAFPTRDSSRVALVLTSLVEGLSGRWLTGQIDVAEARSAIHEAITTLAKGTQASR
ncbi:TetR/AcrR family transcriptional regulator [Leucobacter salsicius]|uniref:TetR/AcrR family transcriptional regulator n=1 Tax=Leucobacter salsicius TaxID=664638 RepID=UPI0003462AE7|nr:TetR/AcrR family transcriptional regulator [Leucobacter salsicius]